MLVSHFLFFVDKIAIQENLSSLGIYLIAAHRTFPSVNRILTNYQRFKFATPFMTNIRDQFDFNRKNYFDGELSNKKIDLSSKVSIRDCDFSYLNESKDLNNLSYDFELGKYMGLKAQVVQEKLLC